MQGTLQDLKQWAKNFLITRKQSYIQVFNPESIHVKRVLKDLAKFCRANESTFHVDQRAHAVAEGRREVWLRIEKHLKMPTNEFINFYGKDLE